MFPLLSRQFKYAMFRFCILFVQLSLIYMKNDMMHSRWRETLPRNTKLIELGNLSVTRFRKKKMRKHFTQNLNS